MKRAEGPKWAGMPLGTFSRSTMAKSIADDATSKLLVAFKAMAVCEFVAIMCADPDGIPKTPGGMQRSAEVMLTEIGADFPAQYQETLDAGVLSVNEQHRARLRSNRDESIPG